MKWLIVFAVVTLGLAITIGILGADSEQVVRLPVPSATDDAPMVEHRPEPMDDTGPRHEGGNPRMRRPPSDPVGDRDCGPECYGEELRDG